MKGHAVGRSEINHVSQLRLRVALPFPRFVAFALACVVAVFAAGCGGGSGSNSKITVQIIPGSTQSIDTGQSLMFSATLANDTATRA